MYQLHRALTQPELHPRRFLLAFPIVLFDKGRDRLVCNRGKPESMPSLARLIVQGLGVIRHALVPNEDGASLVAHAALEVLALGYVVEKEAEEIIGLLLVESHNLLSVHWVHVCRENTH